MKFKWMRSKNGLSWEAWGQTGNGSWRMLEGRVMMIWKGLHLSFQAVRITDNYSYVDDTLYATRTEAMRRVEECDGLEFAKHATSDDITQLPMTSQREINEQRNTISNTRKRPGSNARR